MKKYTILFASILLSINYLQAQVNKEVEVTKAYIPQVERAEKPLLKAIIADTAYINPDVDYNITPLSINTQLQTKPINPATVTYWEFNKSPLAQVKVGAGLPFNSLLQAYASSHNASVGYLAASIDHSGNYSDIKSSMGDMVNATQTLNSVDLAAGLYVGDRELRAALDYDYNLYNNYAFTQTLSPTRTYQQVGGAVSYGDKFVDLSALNYSALLSLHGFFDAESNVNNSFAIGGKVGQSITLGDLIGSIDYKTISGGEDYASGSLQIAAQLETSYLEWEVSAGAQFNHEQTELYGQRNSKNYLIPQLSIYRSTRSTLQPFAQLGGEVRQNSFEQLAKVNPYIYGGAAAKSSTEYNFAGGIMGQTGSSALSYKLYVGYQIELNAPFWALVVIDEPSYSATDVYTSYFVVDSSNLNTTSLNGEINYSPITNLALSLKASYFAYSGAESSLYLNSRPKYNVELGAEYSLRRFMVGITGEFVGARSYSSMFYTNSSSVSIEEVEVSLPAYFDLSAYAEYSRDSRMSFFVVGKNLCGANIYPYPLFRGFGAQVTAGVKINFR